MVKRLKEVLIEERDHGDLTVWTDASVEDLRKIEGVEQVLSLCGSRYAVYCDPRYDLEEIKVEIAGLVKS